MDSKKLLFIAMITATLMAGEAYAEDPWTVTIRAEREHLAYIKKRAELKMARSVEFCRGFYMPQRQGQWKCKENAPKVSTCVMEYRCDLINKKFNRVSETRQIRRELEQLPRLNSNFKIFVSKKPVSKVGTYGLAETTMSKKEIKNEMDKRLTEAKKQTDEWDEFEDFEDIEETPTAEKKERKIRLEDLKDRNTYGAVDEVSNKKKVQRAKYQVERMTSTDGKERIYKVKRNEDEQDQGFKHMYWLAFSGALTKISDENDNSVGATDVAWTPRYRFNENWSLRGQFGGHFLKANINDESETFLVYDFGGSLEWNFLSGLYAECGFGIQSWSSSTGGSYATQTLGLGYRFDYFKVKVIDRIFASYTAVGNEDKNKEAKVGIGVTF